MSTIIASIRLSPTERRHRVALGVQAGKSNRAIAKELGVDEGTVRLDRKFLATPENERPIRVPRPKKPKEPKKEKPAREFTPEERRQQYWQLMLNTVQLWIAQEGLIRPHLELFVLPEAGKLLHRYSYSQSQLPEPVKNPDELISWTRPTDRVEDDMPSKLPFYAEWLARWLACCLPGNEGLQDEFLSQISIWARSRESGFVY